MNLENPVVKLCIEGTQAEYQGQIDTARSLYRQAWDTVQDDFDACVAAHYMARHQADPQEGFYWNQLALQKAQAAGSENVQEFYPSLYLNMGRSYELLGEVEEAVRLYEMAAELGAHHSMDATQNPPDRTGRDSSSKVEMNTSGFRNTLEKQGYG